MKKEQTKKICCSEMAAQLKHQCDLHKNIFDCPDNIVCFKGDMFGIRQD